MIDTPALAGVSPPRQIIYARLGGRLFINPVRGSRE